jgi:hypothetical protein
MFSILIQTRNYVLREKARERLKLEIENIKNKRSDLTN